MHHSDFNAHRHMATQRAVRPHAGAMRLRPLDQRMAVIEQRQRREQRTAWAATAAVCVCCMLAAYALVHAVMARPGALFGL